jgi:hypothetical protein
MDQIIDFCCGVQIELQVDLQLQGPAAACTVIPTAGSVVVGDESGGFTVLRVADGLMSLGCEVYRITMDTPPCLPSHLAYMSQGIHQSLPQQNCGC